MLNAFKLKDNQLTRITDEGGSSSLRRAIWIDLVAPSEEEYCWMEEELGNKLTKFFKLETVINRDRFFKDDNVLYICSLFFYDDVDYLTDNVSVAFIIRNGKLYTLRKQDISVFHVYQMYIDNSTDAIMDSNVYTILLDIFEIKLDHLVDKIERIYSDIGTLGVLIMDDKQIKKYDVMFSTLANLEEIIWKIRCCLLDTQRAINFLVRKEKMSNFQMDKVKEIVSDIDFLLPHNEVLLQKVNFLIQTTMGFMNIEQNRIIRIFSIIFLPPTLVASSYGMNFEFMPELKWVFGYPGAIILMILTGLAPYLYFKHKNWL